MVMKGQFKNEHVFAFREGNFEEIPAEVLVQLKEKEDENKQKGESQKASSKKASEKEVKE